MNHPDAQSSSFSPDQGWCKHCGLVLRVRGVKWYGQESTGPYCRMDCVRASGNEGALHPDYQEVTPLKGRPGFRQHFPADLWNQLVEVVPLEDA